MPQRRVGVGERPADRFPFAALVHRAEGGPIVVALGQRRLPEEVVRALGIQVAGIERAEVLHQCGHDLAAASQLVAQREHDEGRMVAERLDDPLGLGAKIGVVSRLAAEGLPVGKLRLEIHAQAVGRGEGGIGRAPGVEADVVYAVRLADAEIVLPPSGLHWRVAGQGEHATVVLAAEEGWLAVNCELRTLGLELPHPKTDLLGFVDYPASRYDRRVQVIDFGMELVP